MKRGITIFCLLCLVISLFLCGCSAKLDLNPQENDTPELWDNQTEQPWETPEEHTQQTDAPELSEDDAVLLVLQTLNISGLQAMSNGSQVMTGALEGRAAISVQAFYDEETHITTHGHYYVMKDTLEIYELNLLADPGDDDEFVKVSLQG